MRLTWLWGPRGGPWGSWPFLWEVWGEEVEAAAGWSHHGPRGPPRPQCRCPYPRGLPPHPGRRRSWRGPARCTCPGCPVWPEAGRERGRTGGQLHWEDWEDVESHMICKLTPRNWEMTQICHINATWDPYNHLTSKLIVLNVQTHLNFNAPIVN